MGIYEEIGVRPFINTIANHTRYGGAIMPSPVVQAMVEAARQSVNIHELQRAAGRAIAAMTRNEACYISCGAASGVQLAVAACIAGTDESLARQLPTVRHATNVVMQGSQEGTEADTAIRNTGTTIRLAGDSSGVTADQLAGAIDRETVAVVTLDWEGDNMLNVAEVCEVARDRDVSVVVDAADCVPPAANFWRYTRDCGAAAVVISGGKRLRGPQNTGLVLGSPTIVDGCEFLGSPNDRFGRSMKVSKEAMVGIYAAVKYFIENENEMAEAASSRAAALIRDLSKLDDISVHRSDHQVFVRLRRTHLSDDQVRSQLLAGDPAILVFCRDNTLMIDVTVLQPDEVRIVARRLREILDQGLATNGGE